MERRTSHILMPKPFSLKATALGHGWHECTPISWSEGGQCLQVIDRLGNTPVRVSLIQDAPKKTHVRIRLAAEASGISAKDMSLVRSRVGTMLRQDLDLSEFYTLIRDHSKLQAIPRIGAGRIMRAHSMVENIIKAICATNVNWAQGVKMINRIGQLGPCLRHFRNLNAWPTPREIITAGEDYLLNVARVGYRAKSILSFCQSVVDGSCDPESLDELAKTATTKELREQLQTIPGIGPASAHFLLTLLGRFDHVSIDSWTLAYVGKTYLNGRKATPKEVEAIYAPFGRWRHLIWWYEQWLEWDTAQSML